MFSAYKKTAGRTQYTKKKGEKEQVVDPNFQKRDPYLGTTASSFLSLHKPKANSAVKRKQQGAIPKAQKKPRKKVLKDKI